jgi:hypothetical protein
VKTYCSCSKNDYICRGLHEEPLTYLNDVLWVHAKCCLPFLPVWERYIRRCEGCLKQRCLPWEVYCQQCFKYEFQTGTPYKGLLRASKQARRTLLWPLPQAGKLDPVRTGDKSAGQSTQSSCPKNPIYTHSNSPPEI